jgi:hypothetical protein
LREVYSASGWSDVSKKLVSVSRQFKTDALLCGPNHQPTLVISQVSPWNLKIVELVWPVIVEEQTDIGTSSAGDLRERNIEPPYIFRRIDVREVNTRGSDFGRISAAGDTSDCFGFIHNAISEFVTISAGHPT